MFLLVWLWFSVALPSALMMRLLLLMSLSSPVSLRLGVRTPRDSFAWKKWREKVCSYCSFSSLFNPCLMQWRPWAGSSPQLLEPVQWSSKLFSSRFLTLAFLQPTTRHQVHSSVKSIFFPYVMQRAWDFLQVSFLSWFDFCKFPCRDGESS